jgi:putative transposase
MGWNDRRKSVFAFLRRRRYTTQPGVAERTPGIHNQPTLSRTPKGFHAVPQSLVQLYAHLVFSTKHRHPFFTAASVREKVFGYLAGTCKRQCSPAIRVGGHYDHVHILCRLGKESSVSTLVRELKRDSSKWIKTLDPTLQSFSWQAGYGAFSVSPGHVESLIDYIDRQDEHHSKTSFQVEFRRICKKYGITPDEQYCWD